MRGLVWHLGFLAVYLLSLLTLGAAYKVAMSLGLGRWYFHPDNRVRRIASRHPGMVLLLVLSPLLVALIWDTYTSPSWYLLRASGLPGRPAVALNEWKRVRRFNISVKCEQHRRKLIGVEVQDRHPESLQGIVPSRVAREMKETARVVGRRFICIASDDPRLK